MCSPTGTGTCDEDRNDLINHLTKDDVPVYMIYSRPNTIVTAETSSSEWVHHVKLGLKLQEAMRELGLECIVTGPNGARISGLPDIRADAGREALWSAVLRTALDINQRRSKAASRCIGTLQIIVCACDEVLIRAPFGSGRDNSLWLNHPFRSPARRSCKAPLRTLVTAQGPATRNPMLKYSNAG